MWFLKSVYDEKIYYIKPDVSKHTVSRSAGELVIPGDPSISRNHAFLYPAQDTLKVVDAGSRYGTFINEAIENERNQIPKDVPTILQTGDRIRFGKCKSLWLVDRVEFNCITSTISVNAQLKQSLSKLGGRVGDGFQQDITRYLIMKTITTTPKLLMCLIAQVPVVKPEYFDECVKALEEGSAFPNTDNFIPEFAEAYVRSEGITFTKVPERKNLFAGKEFVFVKPKHMSQYEGIIKLAGGKCICAQKRKIVKSYFTQPNVIVMQALTDSLTQGSSQAIDGLTQIVTNAGRRLIPDAEIGLAVLHCSLEKYCNPLYKFTNVLDLETIPFNPGETLASNSEEVSKSTHHFILKESISIPETESRDSSQTTHSDNTGSINKDRELSKVSEEVSEFVKPAENTSESLRSKRKRIKDDEEQKKAKKVCSTVAEVDAPAISPSQFEIPETPSYHSHNAAGFLSVNHKAADSEPQPSQIPKRGLNLMLDDDDDHLFSFERAPPKRSRRQPTLLDSFHSSQSSQNKNGTSDHDDEDLFSFSNNTTKRQKRHVSSTANSGPVSHTNVNQETAKQSNDSCTTYKRFIKPINVPADGWLSSTFYDLKIKSKDENCNDENQNTESSVKVKQELDDADDDQKSRIWIDGMEAMFQVRIKCMNLVSHRPQHDESYASSSTSTGTKNFKAFVKKQNFKPQETIVRTKPVCVLDSTQDDNF